MSYIEIFIVLLFLLSFVLFFYFSKEITSPPKIFLIIWFFYILSSLILLHNLYQWSYSALIWIYTDCTIYLITFYYGCSIFVNFQNSSLKINKYRKNIKLPIKFIVFVILLAFLYVFGIITLNGFSISNLINLDDVLDMNVTIAYGRYNGNNENNIFLQILSIFVYVGPLIGGYSIVHSERKFDIIICYLTFVPSILNVLIQNTKLGVVASVFLWVSGYFTSYLQKYKQAYRFSSKTLFKIIFLILMIVAVLYLSMLFRIGKIDVTTAKIVNHKFLSYALGHVPVFDYWFSNGRLDPVIVPGQYTFYGIYNALNIVERDQGVYQTMVHLGPISSNIYTLFRGMISDFGVIGGFVFQGIYGIITGVLYGKIKYSNNENIIAQVIIANSYFFVMHIFNSVWTYSNYILTFVIFALYLYLINRREKNENEL
ncbi:O-antigen polymerase [Eubacterium callanderi]|uniref:Oligosaccharide repeat unit polymerase n=1 Tax=Eubacterium limosum TaxID=1736 RepID=A0A6N3CZM6_EUBLI|nr:O-antigen polymerase [Eubacterium callanderi]MBO1704202.1 oligosaccharide repeat unit polymerase [Eubacterium callanderi]